MNTPYRCDVELLRAKRRSPGPFVTKGVRVNGFELPQVRAVKAIAKPGDATIVRIELVVTSIADVEVSE